MQQSNNLINFEDTSLQVLSDSKFNFQTKKINKFNYKLILISLVIFIFIVGLFATISSFIPTPDIIPVVDSQITNNEVNFTSLSKQFYVNYNGKTAYSMMKDNKWVVSLGKIEGKVSYSIGGYYDLGIYKVMGNKTKDIILERDFTGPKASINFPDFVDSKELTFSVNLEKNEPINIKQDDKVIYSKDSQTNLCIPKSENKSFECKIPLTDSKENKISITLVDELNNNTKISPKLVKVVDPLKLECNENKIANEGIIECNTNRKVKAVLQVDDKKTEFKDSTKLEYKIDSNDAKTFKIALEVQDEFNIKKEFKKEILVDKEPYDASMWVETIRNDKEYYIQYNVYAKANKDSDFEAYSKATLVEYPDFNSEPKYTYYPTERAKVFTRSDLPKNEVVLVKSNKYGFTGCESICLFEDYTVNIHPVNNPEKIIVYLCKSSILKGSISKCYKG
jgi:hypothetical protein